MVVEVEDPDQVHQIMALIILTPQEDQEVEQEEILDHQSIQVVNTVEEILLQLLQLKEQMVVVLVIAVGQVVVVAVDL